jgi:hypothetical protein
MGFPTDTFSGHSRREFSVELPRDPKTGDVLEYAKPVPTGRAQLDSLIQDARFAKRKRENMAALPSRGLAKKICVLERASLYNVLVVYMCMGICER